MGYAGYDTVRYFERLPHAPPDDRQVPDLAFAFYDRMVVFDNVAKTIVVVAMARLDRPGATVESAYDDAWRRVDVLVEQLATRSTDLELVDIRPEGEVNLEYRSNFTQQQFEKAVEKCVEYIRAGDIFQVVLSQRLEVPLTAHPFEIYRTLRIVNPSPFMFYVRTPSVTLVGSSPEVMVRVVDGQVTVRPLAGTRRRGKTEEEDRNLSQELLADPKERAEHVMLVDLGRNDVGRVCRYRSVEVSDVMTIERYSHVMHITSNVCGQLAPGKGAFEALQACLPAGTVSGARRCGRWRSSTSWSRIVAGRMPGRSAMSISAATWTPALPCGRWSCRATRAMCRPAPDRRRQRAGQRVAGNDEQGPRAAEGDRVGRAAITRAPLVRCGPGKGRGEASGWPCCRESVRVGRPPRSGSTAVLDVVDSFADLLEVDAPLAEHVLSVLGVKLADQIAKEADFLDHVAPLVGRVANVIVDPHGGRAHAVDDRLVVFGVR